MRVSAVRIISCLFVFSHNATEALRELLRRQLHEKRAFPTEGSDVHVLMFLPLRPCSSVLFSASLFFFSIAFFFLPPRGRLHRWTARAAAAAAVRRARTEGSEFSVILFSRALLRSSLASPLFSRTSRTTSSRQCAICCACTRAKKKKGGSSKRRDRSSHLIFSALLCSSLLFSNMLRSSLLLCLSPQARLHQGTARSAAAAASRKRR